VIIEYGSQLYCTAVLYEVKHNKLYGFIV
jgi:hypothetical protein